MIKINTKNITVNFVNADQSSQTDHQYFKDLAKQLAPHFTPGLEIDIEFLDPVNYLWLSNPNLNDHQMFDEFWNYREKYWFKLPRKFTNRNHLAIKD